MQYIDYDAQAAPFGTAAEQESERRERVRLYPSDAPPAEWEDEWVDLGGEG
jgi:hypothetical protein